jgi:type I restriction enzyme, R subunit
LNRSATLKGKAMVVCMERKNCVPVRSLDELPDCPEVKIVMTGNPPKTRPNGARKIT